VSAYSITEPSPRQKWVAGALVVTYAVITLLPLLWILATGFKTSSDAIAYPPKLMFQPSLEGYVNLFTTQTRQTPEYLAENPPGTWYEQIVHDKGMVISGPSRFSQRFMNSVIIGFGSTFLSVLLGTLEG
jgi:multiple sugar transport system permease protein